MKKKIMSLPIVMFLLIALAGLVYATCIFNAPASSGTVSGTYVFNVTSVLTDLRNCSVTGSSTLSGGTMTALMLYNTSGGDANITNASKVTNSLRDASDWAFSATCSNSSADTETCSATSVVVDNDAPVVSGCTVEGVAATNRSITESSFPFVCTVYNATACNAYWKTTTAHAFASTVQSGVDYKLSAITFTSSYAATGTTATANLKQAGDAYDTLYMDCSDGADTTTGTTYKIYAEGISSDQREDRESIIGDGTKFIAKISSLFNNKRMLILVMGGVAVFLLLILALVVRKKK